MLGWEVKFDAGAKWVVDWRAIDGQGKWLMDKGWTGRCSAKCPRVMYEIIG